MKSKCSQFSKRRPLAIVAALCLTGQIVMAQEGRYEEGQIQLDNKDYQAASDIFSDLVETDGAKQDAALYWLAYSQFKNGQEQKALSTLSQLTRSHSKSRWLDDAAALKVEIQDESGQGVDVDNEEMKLYALNSLMNSPSEKSLAILERLLAGSSSDHIKRRALFVLSQIDDPKSFEIISVLATDSANQKLQDEAIRVLGISSSEQAMTLLAGIYQSSDAEDIKLKILHSYMVADQSELLVELAKSESNPVLKKQAIHLVGVMSNPEVLLEMYRNAEFIDFRSELIHAIAIGDGAEALVEIVNSEKDQGLLVEAVQKMGINDSDQTGKHLASIYKKNDTRVVRQAVIQALFIQSNAGELINIIKSESDSVLKREALQKLSLMDADESLEYFGNILNSEG